MTIEYDEMGRPVLEADRMEQFMLGLYDMTDEADLAGFPVALIEELHTLRWRFMDEFERRYPGYGQGRATWR